MGAKWTYRLKAYNAQTLYLEVLRFGQVAAISPPHPATDSARLHARGARIEKLMGSLQAIAIK